MHPLTCLIAAGEGHLEALRYGHENGCVVDAYTCYTAARNGHVDCLFYAHECTVAKYGCIKSKHGFPWGESTCRMAALNGRIVLLRYAHENGFLWDEATCEAAAENGHLECLRYAHENRCPWDTDTCKVAARNGHLVCLKYAIENGCPISERDIREFIASTSDNVTYDATDSSHMACMAYLQRSICPVAKLVDAIFDSVMKSEAATVIQRKWKEILYRPGSGSSVLHAVQRHFSTTTNT
jgi:hypothetical protein